MNSRPPLDELARLFPSEPFEFSIGLGPGDLRSFFADSPDHDALIAERKKWLAQAPEHYFGAEAEAEPIIQEFIHLGRANGFIGNLAAADPSDAFRELAKTLETEVMLMRRAGDGQHILSAGAVCFPSSWSLAEKLGKSLATIHEPVPTVNTRFAARIDAFLSRMKPGHAWERSNWGLSRSPELNQHPSRRLPRLDATVEPQEVFFRLEKQLLTPLPATGGTVFALRLYVYSLPDLLGNTELRSGLARALNTMPAEIALYKGIAPARERLLSFL